jgi:hypothetical protein
MVTSMWKLLGKLAMQYCQLAAWSMASGQAEAAVELVDKARACLVQRGSHSEPKEVELTDVL